jgi:hypothetical protein
MLDIICFCFFGEKYIDREESFLPFLRVYMRSMSISERAMEAQAL